MPYYNRDPKRDHNFDSHPYGNCPSLLPEHEVELSHALFKQYTPRGGPGKADYMGFGFGGLGSWFGVQGLGSSSLGLGIWIQGRWKSFAF